MNSILARTILVALIVASQPFVYGQSNSKNQLIMEIIKVTDVIPQAKTAVNSMLNSYSKKYPAIPASTWTDLKNHIDYDRYQKSIYVVYNRDLNEKELGELLKQYQHSSTPAKVILSEKLKADLYAAGNEFGRSIGALIKSKIGQ
jgi:hypothetical protein